MVSVPCTTTVPAMPLAPCVWMPRAKSITSSGSIDAPGFRNGVSTSTLATWSISGSNFSRSSPVSLGVIPSLEGAMVMVPPRTTTRTVGNVIVTSLLCSVGLLFAIGQHLQHHVVGAANMRFTGLQQAAQVVIKHLLHQVSVFA